MPRSNAGVALVSVLLIVAILMAVISRLLAGHNLVINQHQNTFEQNQALQYVLGAEVLAQEVLQIDRENTGNVDHLEEQWAQRAIPFELDEGGFIEARIVDLHACFNLNSLSSTSTSPTSGNNTNGGAVGNNLASSDDDDENQSVAASRSRSVAATRQLQNLLTSLDVPAVIAENWRDWIDENELTDTGAEGSDYLLDTPPHLTPDNAVTHVSELRSVRDMEPEIYAAIEPHICILPDSNTSINVNTASAEVLASLTRDVSVSDAQSIVDLVRTYDQVSEFTDENEDFLPVSSMLAVESTYFLLQAEAQFGESRVSLESILRRNGGNITVLQRDFGRLFRSSIEVDIDPS